MTYRILSMLSVCLFSTLAEANVYSVSTNDDLDGDGSAEAVALDDLELKGSKYSFSVKLNDSVIHKAETNGEMAPEISVVDIDQADKKKELVIREMDLSGKQFHLFFHLTKKKLVPVGKITSTATLVFDGRGNVIGEKKIGSFGHKELYSLETKLVKKTLALQGISSKAKLQTDAALLADGDSKSGQLMILPKDSEVTILVHRIAEKSPKSCKPKQGLNECDWMIVSTPTGVVGWLQWQYLQ